MAAHRFYPTSGKARNWMTALWAAVLLLWLGTLIAPPHHGRWRTAIWVLLAVVNLVSLWLNYWTVDTRGLVQHAAFRVKRYQPDLLRYAGQPLTRTMKRWARKTIELQFAGDAVPRYALVAEREAFLNAVRAAAPQADFEP